jgi:hypothetical protein
MEESNVQLKSTQFLRMQKGDCILATAKNGKCIENKIINIIFIPFILMEPSNHVAKKQLTVKYEKLVYYACTPIKQCIILCIKIILPIDPV